MSQESWRVFVEKLEQGKRMPTLLLNVFKLLVDARGTGMALGKELKGQGGKMKEVKMSGGEGESDVDMEDEESKNESVSSAGDSDDSIIDVQIVPFKKEIEESKESEQEQVKNPSNKDGRYFNDDVFYRLQSLTDMGDLYGAGSGAGYGVAEGQKTESGAIKAIKGTDTNSKGNFELPSILPSESTPTELANIDLSSSGINGGLDLEKIQSWNANNSMLKDIQSALKSSGNWYHSLNSQSNKKALNGRLPINKIVKYEILKALVTASKVDSIEEFFIPGNGSKSNPNGYYKFPSQFVGMRPGQKARRYVSLPVFGMSQDLITNNLRQLRKETAAEMEKLGFA
jgi:hypothetical protein